VIISNDSLYYTTSSGNTYITQLLTPYDSIVKYATPTQVALKMTNFGGAPGFIVGPDASLPSPSIYLLGTVYISQDSGTQRLDTGTLGAQGWKRLAGGSSGGSGADSAVNAGYGNLKTVVGTNIFMGTDTTLSYFLSHIVNGLNNNIVGDGNSNSVGFNNPPGTGTNIPHSYPTISFNALGGTAAGYTVQVLGVPSQTTQQMITNAPSVIDPQYNASFTHNYLYSWEMENDIQINAISAFQAVTNMNNYYTARNAVGWRTIGATALTKTNGSGYDSLLTSTIDSANLYLVHNHTSNLFIDFRGNPWLNNNMSRAGFGPDYIHMNASGTQVMADSFSYYVKKDQGRLCLTQPILSFGMGM
jgi:hypothetical protein